MFLWSFIADVLFTNNTRSFSEDSLSKTGTKFEGTLLASNVEESENAISSDF